MPEVGSVSIRVRPDLKGFREEVQAALAGIKDLKIPVNLDLDKGALEAELAKLRNEHITIPAKVDLDNATIGRELAKKPITIPAKVDINQDEIGRALAGRKITIPAEVKVDHDPFKAMLAGIGRDIGTLVKSDIGNLTSAFSNVGSVGEQAFSSIQTAAGGLAGVVTTGFTTLVKIPAIATAIAAAGAAITAAWGAASTAVAAVPAAIGLIGAPLATALLGMDGIKKAAQTLAPEFTKLKAAVSSTFQQGLTPIFSQLKGSLTALTPSIQAVATSMVGLAQQTANWITNLGGLQQIQTVFTNVAAAIGQINLVPLLDGFTRLAGNQAALKALTTTINQLGIEIQKIANNNSNLNSAFAGLEGVLKSLTTAFGDLVNNGLTTFAAAAPGVQDAINGIGTFFNKFNWTSLGAAAGNALRGIGTALASIPQGTIDSITTSFEGLGAAFNSQSFKDGIAGFAKAIPVAVDALSALVTVFGQVGQAVGAVTNFLGLGTQAVQHYADGVSPLANQIDLAFKGTLISAQQNLSQVPIVTDQELAKVGPIFSQVLGTAQQVAAQKFGLIPPTAQQGLSGLVPAVQSATAPVVPTFQAALSPLAAAMTGSAQGATVAFTSGLQGLLTGAAQVGNQVPPAILTPIDILQQKLPMTGQAIAQGFGNSLGTMPGYISTGLAGVVPAADAGLAPLATTSVPTGVQNMVNAVNAALPGFGTAFQTGLAQLAPLVTTGFQTLSTTSIPQGLTAMGTALTSGFTTLLGPAITTGFTGLAPIFAQNFTALGPTAIVPGLTALGASLTAGFTTLLGPAITTGFTALLPAFTTGFTTLGTTAIIPGLTLMGTQLSTGFTTVLGPAITTGFTALAPLFLQGFTLLNTTAITPGMTAMGLALTTAFTTVLGPAITLGFTALGPLFLQGFTLLNTTAITPGMTALGVALTAAFTTVLGPAVTAGFAALNAVFLAGFTTLAASATAGMATITTAITAGFAQVNAAITAGFATANAAFTAGFQTMTQTVTTFTQQFVQAITQAMQQFTQAVQQGMQQALAAVKSGVAAIISALQSAAGQAQAAGVALGQGFVNGIKSQEGAARAAGAALGQAAVDGMNSVKGINSGSPSKKGVKSGLNLGGSFADSLFSTRKDAAFSGAAVGTMAAESITDAYQSRLDSFDFNAATAKLAAVGGFNADAAKQAINLGGVQVQIGDERIRELIRVIVGENTRSLVQELRAG